MKRAEIFYSQDSIKEKYDDGHTIYSTLSVCKKHPFVRNQIPRIRVCQRNGKIYSLDNRRLWVFKKLEADGYITGIPVKTVSNDRLTPEKFTTQNGGESVEIRQRWWHRLWWNVLDRKFCLLNSRFQEQRQVYTYRCRVETQPHLDIALQFCLMLIVCILKKCIHNWSIMNILLIVYNDFKYTRFLSIKQTDIN